MKRRLNAIYMDETTQRELKEAAEYADAYLIVVERALANQVRVLGQAKGKLLEVMSLVQQGILHNQQLRERK